MGCDPRVGGGSWQLCYYNKISNMQITDSSANAKCLQIPGSLSISMINGCKLVIFNRTSSGMFISIVGAFIAPNTCNNIAVI